MIPLRGLGTHAPDNIFTVPYTPLTHCQCFARCMQAIGIPQASHTVGRSKADKMFGKTDSNGGNPLSGWKNEWPNRNDKGSTVFFSWVDQCTNEKLFLSWTFSVQLGLGCLQVPSFNALWDARDFFQKHIAVHKKIEKKASVKHNFATIYTKQNGTQPFCWSNSNLLHLPLFSRNDHFSRLFRNAGVCSRICYVVQDVFGHCSCRRKAVKVLCLLYVVGGTPYSLKAQQSNCFWRNLLQHIFLHAVGYHRILQAEFVWNIRPSNSSYWMEKIWKIPSHKRWCIPQNLQQAPRAVTDQAVGDVKGPLTRQKNLNRHESPAKVLFPPKSPEWNLGPAPADSRRHLSCGQTWRKWTPFHCSLVPKKWHCLKIREVAKNWHLHE